MQIRMKVFFRVLIYRVYNHRTSSIKELINVAFDKSSPQKSGKGICYDVSGVIMERLINNKSLEEDPDPKIKDMTLRKIRRKDYMRMTNKIPQTSYLEIGQSQRIMS